MAGEREDIRFDAKIEGAAALRVIKQLRDALRDLLKVQTDASRGGANRAQIQTLREEIAERQKAVIALKAELAARRQSTQDTVSREIAAQKERIKGFQSELRAQQESAQRIQEAGRARTQAAIRDLSEQRKQTDQNIRNAVASARATIEAAKAKKRAEEEQTRAQFAEAQKRFRGLQQELREQKDADAKTLAAIRQRVQQAEAIASRARATPAQRGAATRARNQLGTAQEAAAEAARERRVRLDAARDELRETRDQLNAKLRNLSIELEAVRNNERAKVAAIRETQRARVQDAKDQLALARQNATQGSAFAIREIEQARQRLALAKQTAKEQIAQAKNNAKAITDPIAAQVRAGQQQIGMLRAQVGALRAAGASVRQYTRDHVNMANVMRTSTSVLSDLRRQLLIMVTAFGAISKTLGFFKEGIAFNQVIETSTLGIAALITAEANLRNEQGRLLQGTEALGAAQVLASDQIRQLRIAGIETSATTKELVTAFQEAVGAGISVGLTLDQIRKFTVSVAQAATTINLPFNQLNQEVRSILQGTIDRNSRIAKALQLTNEEVRLAKEQGRLYDLLNEKFKAFNVAGVESLKTWATLESTIEDAKQLLAGEITHGFFDQMRDAGQKALREIFDLDQARIQTSFRGIILGFSDIMNEIGSAFADGILAAVDAARELSKWFAANRDSVHATVVAFGTMIRQIGGLISDIIGMGTHMGEAATAAGDIQQIFETITSAVVFLRENIELIRDILVGMIAGAVFSLAITNPLAAAVTLALALAGALNKSSAAAKVARGEFERGTQTWARQTTEAIRLGEEYIALREKAEKLKKGSEERAQAEAQLIDVGQRLAEVDSRYAGILSNTTLRAREQAEAIRRVGRVRLEQMQDTMRTLREQKRQGEEQLADLGDKDRINGALLQRVGESDAAFEHRKELIAATKAQIEGIEGSMDSVRASIKTVTDAFIKADQVIRGIRLEVNKDGLQKANNDALEAAKGRLKIAQAEEKEHEEIVRQRFEAGLLSNAEYQNALQAQALHTLDVEREVADAELALARSKADEGQIEAAKSHQEAIEAKKREVINESHRKQAAEERNFQETKRKIETEALTKGDSDDRLIASARQAAEEYREQLQLAFREKDFKLALNISHLIDIRTAELQFDQLKEVAGKTQDDLQAKTDEIANQVNLGVISREEGLKRFAAATSDSAASIVEVYVAALKLQGVLKDNPEFVKFLAEINKLLIEMKDNFLAATDPLVEMKAAFRSAAQSGILTFFDELGDRSKNFADIVTDSLRTVVDEFRKFITQMLALRLTQAIFGSFGAAAVPGAVPAGAGAGAMGGPVETLVRRSGPRRAMGGPAHRGLVDGPGTPTSDSIPLLWVSKKEYVQPEHAMTFYGSEGLRFMEAFRRHDISRDFMKLAMKGMKSYPILSRTQSNMMSVGGSVANVRTGGGSPARQELLQVTVGGHIGVDRRGFIDFIEGPEMKRTVVKHIQNAPRQVGRAVQPQRRPG